MRLKSKVVVQLMEATDAVGLSRGELLAAVGLDERTLADPHGYVTWNTFVALVDGVWTRLGQDAEQMRRVGRALVRAPSYALLRRLARTVVSLNRLFEIATRWGTPGTFPHVIITHEALSERRARFTVTVPEPHAVSVPMFHVFEGILLEVPTLLDLPRAALVSSEISERSVETVIQLPPTVSLGGRLRRAVHLPSTRRMRWSSWRSSVASSRRPCRKRSAPRSRTARSWIACRTTRSSIVTA